jgi:hypothetical protein
MLTKIPRRKDNTGDRRAAYLPIRQEVRYKVLGEKGPKQIGAGITVNMSRVSVVFTTEVAVVVAEGEPIELIVNWPGRVRGVFAKNLVIWGGYSDLTTPRWPLP